MSANETNTDNTAEAPATAVQKSAAPETPAAPPQVSRLYARLRRDKSGGPTQTVSPLSSEPVTSADNLPVRATAPAHLIGDSDRPNEERYERPERRERRERPERRERSDHRDRGRNRRDHGGRFDREERRPEPADTAAESQDSTEEPAKAQPVEGLDSERETSPSEQRPQRPQRRGPRFEESGDQGSDRSHLIQEFKPSRHAKSTSNQASRKGTAEKKGSLMGWIKSVFTGGEATPETPAATPSRNRPQGNRGPRGQGRSGPGNRDGAPRRRRRGRRSGSGGGQGRGQNRGPRNNGGRSRPRD